MPFPTTSVLDNFNRSNEGPPPSSSWTQTGYCTHGLLVSGSVLQIATVATDSADYWNVSTFGPDVEVYITLPAINRSTISAGVALDFRMQTPGGSDIDCYEVDLITRLSNADANILRVWRVDNSAFTQLDATINQTITAGDSYGAAMSGSTIAIYYKVGSGSWVALTTRGDNTYSSAGNIGAYGFENSAITQQDNFGGGTIAGGSLIISASATLTGIGINDSIALKSIFALLSLVGRGDLSTVASIISLVTEQEGFRWRNDDGTEITASWRQSQDVNDLIPVLQNIRLRIIINTSGSSNPSQFKLQYKLSTDSTWKDVLSE